MLKFKLVNAMRFDVYLSLEDMGRYESTPGVINEIPTGGIIRRIGKRWSWENVPYPLLHGEHRQQLAHAIFNLDAGRTIAPRADANLLNNFARDWQQMPNVEKGHETIKAATTTEAAVKAELSLITGNPAGWTWDDSIGDYVKQS